MTAPVLPPAAETSPAAGEHPTTIADLIDRPADLIAAHGLEVGDFWADSTTGDGWDDCSVCIVGAVAVALGMRTRGEVEHLAWTGGGPLGAHADAALHPALHAVMVQLRCTSLDQLMDWSDSARQDQVVTQLREAAAAEREGRPS